MHRDLEGDYATLEVIKDEGTVRIEDADIELTDETREYYRYAGDDFSSPSGEVVTRQRLRREGWDIETRARTLLTADGGHFHVHAELDAYENGQRVFSRNWNRRIRRQLL